MRRQKNNSSELEKFIKIATAETFALLILSAIFGWEWLFIIMPGIATLTAMPYLFEKIFTKYIITNGMLAMIIIIIAMEIYNAFETIINFSLHK